MKYGCTYLSELGEFHTRWVCSPDDARKYSSKKEAELVAYAVEGDVEEIEGGVN